MISSLPQVVEATRDIRAGRLSPSDLVANCLLNIEQHEPQIRAWVLVDADGARKEAERLDQLARQGNYVGPLHGIPIGIKDIVDVAGWSTRAGSPLREDHVADCDAELVASLRRAGAIILGKTVTTEFACFDPPVTRNPMHPEHTPGGSSSGSAAAVASGMCLAAIGSQTGGSIIRPASYCGICGLKPTFGAISLAGVVPVSRHLDHPGPLAGSVDDLAVVFSALSSDIVQDYHDAPPAAPHLRPVHDFFFEAADSRVRSLTESAVDRLGAGPPLALPTSFPELLRHHRRIMAVEAADYHDESFGQFADKYGVHISSLIREGLSTSAIDFLRSRRHQRKSYVSLQQWLPLGQFAVMPATPTIAPRDRGTTGDPKFNSPWSYVGMPAVTLPCGAIDGLPCGLQLVGRRGEDVALLRAAAWCETRVNGR
jgi:aspartyl-tRNA(Asn)/glutamyl-tRNA(Gln) amidotransferase subunit A